MSSLDLNKIECLSKPEILEMENEEALKIVDLDMVIEVESLILAAMDTFDYDKVDENHIIVRVPKGKFELSGDLLDIDDEAIDAVKDIDLDEYRKLAKELIDDNYNKEG